MIGIKGRTMMLQTHLKFRKSAHQVFRFCKRAMNSDKITFNPAGVTHHGSWELSKNRSKVLLNGAVQAIPTFLAYTFSCNSHNNHAGQN